MLLFFISSVMITHLGINPVSGGSPPSDSNVVNIIKVIVGARFHVSDNDSVVVLAFIIRRENIVRVIMM